MERLLGKEHRSYLMGLAILWIVAFHFCFYGNLLQSRFFGLLFSRGYLGVDIFLFLSAYGLCFSYERNSLKQFYMNRFWRLYPMYFAFVAVTLFFFHQGYDDSPLKLAIFQCTGLSSFRMVDFEWYIPALIVVYVTFPLLFLGVKWLYDKRKWMLPLFVVLLSLLVPVISKVVFPMFAYRFPIIILGIVTYFALKNQDRKYLLSAVLICALFPIIARIDEKITLSMMLPLLLFGLGEVLEKVPFENSISFIGRHSLEIYLAQSFALNHFFLNNVEMRFWLKSLIALAIIIVGSVLLNYIQKGCKLLFSVK